MNINKETIYIVIPAYNEEHSIVETLMKLKELKVILEKTFVVEIILVVDGSIDKTLEYAQATGVGKILTHQMQRGLGASVRTGIEFAKENNADIVVKIDADLQHEVADIVKLVDKLKTTDSDLVYGNRFNKLSYKMPWFRYFGNIFFSFLVAKITSWQIKDAQPGIFAMSKRFIQVIDFPGDYNCTQQILLDAFYKKMRFTDFDVNFYKRRHGKSFVDFRYPFIVIFLMLRIMVRALFDKNSID